MKQYYLKTENRYATEKPRFKLKSNYNYVDEINKYIGDRISKRVHYLYISKYIKGAFGNFDNGQGKYKLLYDSKFYDAINYDKIDDVFNNLDTNKISTNIDKFYDFCSLNKIKCFIIVAPNKVGFIENRIYKKKDYVGELNSKLTTKHKIINPYPLLEEAHKKDNVFYIFDHHLNNYGALQVWNLLLENIGLPKIENVEWEKSHYKIRGEHGDLYEDIYRMFYYNKYKYIRTTKSYTNSNDYNGRMVKSSDGIYDKKNMVLGSSFSYFDNISFAFTTFKQNLYFSNSKDGINVLKYRDVIKDYKPDYLVIYLNSARIKEFENFMEK